MYLYKYINIYIYIYIYIYIFLYTFIYIFMYLLNYRPSLLFYRICYIYFDSDRTLKVFKIYSTDLKYL